MTRHVLAAIFLIALAPLVTAQERITGANYPLAQKFNKDFVAQHVQEVTVAPQWIGKTDMFWYSVRTATGTRYWKVDPAKKEKVPLFDHVALAAALSEAVEEAARRRHAAARRASSSPRTARSSPSSSARTSTSTTSPRTS